MLYRWTAPGDNAEWITDDVLRQILQDVADVRTGLAKLSPLS